MTPKDVLTEQDEAQISGPIALKEPGSPQWCWQLIAAMQTQWRALNFDYDLYTRTWEDAEAHKVWEKVPYDNPYGSKERMLKALAVGDIPAANARVAENAMTTQPLAEHGTNQHTAGGGSLHYLLPNRRGSAYLTARIARDRPDIWERMRLGEFNSVAAAAREAGIRMPKPRRTVTLGDNVERGGRAVGNALHGGAVDGAIPGPTPAPARREAQWPLARTSPRTSGWGPCGSRWRPARRRSPRRAWKVRPRRSGTTSRTPSGAAKTGVFVNWYIIPLFLNSHITFLSRYSSPAIQDGIGQVKVPVPPVANPSSGAGRDSAVTSPCPGRRQLSWPPPHS